MSGRWRRLAAGRWLWGRSRGLGQTAGLPRAHRGGGEDLIGAVQRSLIITACRSERRAPRSPAQDVQPRAPPTPRMQRRLRRTSRFPVPIPHPARRQGRSTGARSPRGRSRARQPLGSGTAPGRSLLPSALDCRPTRCRNRTAEESSAPEVPSRRRSRAADTMAPAFVFRTITQGALARDSPESALHVTSRRLTTRPSTAPSSVWLCGHVRSCEGSSTSRASMACKGSGVQIPAAPPPQSRINRRVASGLRRSLPSDSGLGQPGA